MRARKVKTVRLGMVCVPQDNINYGYAIVSVSEEFNRLTALILWSSCSEGKLAAGKMWDEPLDQFAASLRDGYIRRVA